MTRLLAALLTVCLLGACSSMPGIPGMAGAASPGNSKAAAAAVAELPASAGAREHVGLAIELMGAGRSEAARTNLTTALEKSPKDATARRLLDQIETDPAVLLGPAASEHVIAAGDTMSVLAERYLGDPLMFYALSRYNGLSAPNALSVGKVLKIPARRSAPPLATAPPKAPSELPPQSSRAAEAARASEVRLLALQSLNEGNVARAVTLLKQAQALNAADPAIQKDLERAMRIQSALDNG